MSPNNTSRRKEAMYSFKFIAKENIKTIIPLLMQLDSNISEAILNQRVDEMLQQGYQCVGAYEEERLIGISGVWVITKYYVGKHVEPDNVFILPEYRNRGIARQLMQWIYNYAQSIGCVASELNCYQSNEAGQNFWLSDEYKPIGIHYQRSIP